MKKDVFCILRYYRNMDTTFFCTKFRILVRTRIWLPCPGRNISAPDSTMPSVTDPWHFLGIRGSVPLTKGSVRYLVLMDPDPGDPKTYGSGSATLTCQQVSDTDLQRTLYFFVYLASLAHYRVLVPTYQCLYCRYVCFTVVPYIFHTVLGWYRQTP